MSANTIGLSPRRIRDASMKAYVLPARSATHGDVSIVSKTSGMDHDPGRPRIHIGTTDAPTFFISKIGTGCSVIAIGAHKHPGAA